MSCNSLNNAFKSIDIFGTEIHLNYKNRSKLQTHFGAFLTLCGVAVFGYLFSIFGAELVDKTKPKTNVSKMKMDSRYYLKNHPVILRLQSYYGLPFPEPDKLFHLTVLKMNFFNATNNWTKITNMTLSKCDPKKHFGSMKEFILTNSTVPLSDAYCLDFGNDTYIQNDYATPNSTFINYFVSICDTDAHKKPCHNDTIKRKWLSEFYAYTYFPNYFIDPNNYENPATLYYDVYIQKIGMDMWRRNRFQFGNTQIKTDYGFFFEDWNLQTITQLQDVTTEIDLRAEDPTLKFTITLENPRLVQQYTRYYNKLQSLLVNLGGMLNLIYTVGNLICYLISEKSFLIQLAKNSASFVELLPESLDIELRNKNTQATSMDKSNRNDSDCNTVQNIKIIPFETSSVNNLKSISNKINLQQIDQYDKSGDNSVIFATKNTNNENKKKLRNTAPTFMGSNNTNLESIIELKKHDISIESLGFCRYISACLCTCRTRSIRNFYDAILSFYEEQLDIRNIIKLKQDLYAIKHSLFSGVDNYKRYFNLKVPVSRILEKYEVKMKKEDAEEKEIDDDQHLIITKHEQNELCSFWNSYSENFKSLKY